MIKMKKGWQEKMVIKSKEIKLKNGQTVILRSPLPSDAESFLDCKRVTLTETYFMARYPEESTATVEKEVENLKLIAEDKDNFML